MGLHPLWLNGACTVERFLTVMPCLLCGIERDKVEHWARCRLRGVVKRWMGLDVSRGPLQFFLLGDADLSLPALARGAVLLYAAPSARSAALQPPEGSCEPACAPL